MRVVEPRAGGQSSAEGTDGTDGTETGDGGVTGLGTETGDGAETGEAGDGGVTGLATEATDAGVGGVVGEAGDIGVRTLVAVTVVTDELAPTAAGLTDGVGTGAAVLLWSSETSSERSSDCGAGVGCWATGPAAKAAAAPTPRAPRAPVTTATVRLFMLVSSRADRARGPVLLC